ncbi:heterokaryon incompatibility protein-domain-containing protein, partial [Trametes meyenii]
MLCPSYAILSHVWAVSETSLQVARDADAHDSDTTDAKRFGISDKILKCCAFARANGYRYLWVDTCCIDKTSSAELTEAINSMAEWYTRAAVCYAYLHDVEYGENPKAHNSSFRRSKWFTRGWTFQELLFPDTVIFLSSNWRMIGTKALLSQPIFEITGILTDVLLHERPLSSVSVAARMSWASRRQTTRVEDEAYCLLGIFGVYIPTIYGEGRHAFVRLQEEILRRIPDQTLFAWG